MARKRKRKKNQGRQYDISDWVEFETDGYIEEILQDVDDGLTTMEVDWDFTSDLSKAQDKFTKEANRVVKGWVKKHPDKAKGLIASDDYESEDDIAWNTWADLVGHGVGFWEHMDRSDYKSLERAIASDRALSDARYALGDEMMAVADNAVSAARGRQSNPKSRRSRKKRNPSTPSVSSLVKALKF